MLQVAREYREWEDKHRCSEDDEFLLRGWIERMEQCHADLLRTRRWRIGSAIIDGLNMLFCRKKNLVTDLMADIFQEFQNRQASFTGCRNPANPSSRDE